MCVITDSRMRWKHVVAGQDTYAHNKVQMDAQSIATTSTQHNVRRRRKRVHQRASHVLLVRTMVQTSTILC